MSQNDLKCIERNAYSLVPSYVGPESKERIGGQRLHMLERVDAPLCNLLHVKMFMRDT